MANLKLITTEIATVKGKRVNNVKNHNISDINTIYQETINLNKRPASYTYLYVAAVPPAMDPAQSVYIEAHTDREFTGTCDGTGSNTTVSLDSAIDLSVLDQASGAGSVAPDLRLVSDVVPTTDSHDDGADDRIISITDNTRFVIGANTTPGSGSGLSDQLITFYGNQKAINGTMVTGQKYIVHDHVPAEDIKVGMRVTGTNIGTNAVVTRIVSNVEFEVDVASSGSASNDIFISDTIKVTFDDDVTQANSTKHIAGVSGIFGAEDNLTNRKSVLTSLKKSLDLWVSAGAPFVIGGISDNGTLPYIKITHSNPGPSVNVREVYGYMVEQNYLFTADRTSLAIGQRTDVFTNEAVSPLLLSSFSDTALGSELIARSGGSSSFSSDNVKYTRITNNGTVDSILYTHVGNSDLKASARTGVRTKSIETTANLQEGYDTNIYIIDILKPGESKIYYNNKVDLLRNSGDTPVLTDIDNIYGASMSASVNASVEVFIASK